MIRPPVLRTSYFVLRTSYFHMPIRVLFVCLGNICRSPMAEAVFRHLVAQAGLADLRALARGGPAKIARLLDYAPGARTRDVPDPYYTGGFDAVYDLVEQGCRGLLEQIIIDHHLTTRMQN